MLASLDRDDLSVWLSINTWQFSRKIQFEHSGFTEITDICLIKLIAVLDPGMLTVNCLSNEMIFCGMIIFISSDTLNRSDISRISRVTVASVACRHVTLILQTNRSVQSGVNMHVLVVKRGPKGHISCTWVQCATFLRNQPGQPSCFSDQPDKYKLGRGCWDLASYQVSLNSVQPFQKRSLQCLSQSEARAAILLFRSAGKTQTW